MFSAEECKNNTINIHKNQIEKPNSDSFVIEDKTFQMGNNLETFKGRQNQMTTIDKYFFDEESNVVVIHGFAGYGKTELARSYAFQHKHKFQNNLIWINAESYENLMKSYKELLTFLDPAFDSKETSMQEIISKIYNYFQNAELCLFILDNVEDITLILNYLPSLDLNDNIKILITSQYDNRDKDKNLKSIHLDPLTKEEAEEVVAAFLSKEMVEKHTKIINEFLIFLEYIPLSMDICFSVIIIIREEKMLLGREFNLEDIINELKTSIKNVPIEKHLKNKVPNYNKTAMALIFFMLNNRKITESQPALNVLKYMSSLDPECVKYDDLLLIPLIKEDSEILDDALYRLINFSLIKTEENCTIIRIHRIVKFVFRQIC